MRGWAGWDMVAAIVKVVVVVEELVVVVVGVVVVLLVVVVLVVEVPKPQGKAMEAGLAAVAKLRQKVENQRNSLKSL